MSSKKMILCYLFEVVLNVSHSSYCTVILHFYRIYKMYICICKIGETLIYYISYLILSYFIFSLALQSIKRLLKGGLPLKETICASGDQILSF